MSIPRNSEVTAAARAANSLEKRLRDGDHEAAHSDCRPVNELLSRIGDKWSVLVVMLLGDEPKRFNEMRRLIGGISQRMLTLTLRGLERDGFVRRTVYPTVPPRVEYTLTPLGRSLREPISRLGEWAFAHRKHVEKARVAFDAGAEPAPAGRVHRVGDTRR
jgi:DNA-binding HxlR family transcriptional regulator